MNMNSIIEEVIKTVKQFAPHKSDNINMNTSLSKDLGYDSIAFVSMVVSLEKNFKFSFDDEYLDIPEVDQFKDLLEYVKKKVDLDGK